MLFLQKKTYISKSFFVVFIYKEVIPYYLTISIYH